MEEMWYGRTEEWRLRLAELCRQVVIVADTADPRAEVRSDGLTGERTEPSCRDKGPDQQPRRTKTHREVIRPPALVTNGAGRRA
jgi:hypothetical protein